MILVLTNTSEVALALSTLVELADSVGNREHLGFSRGSHSSGVRSSDHRSDQISLHSTMMRASSGSNRSACAGRYLWVKANLPTFRDEKSKDVVTYHSCQWDVAILCQSGWNDQHLLLYIFCSLQEFLGNLARSLGKDATLNVILQMLDEHYNVVMTFDTLRKELYSLKQGSSKNIAEFGVHLLQQVQILQLEY